jgi:hypothetical protein
MLLKYRLRLRVIVTNVDEFHDRFDLIHGIYACFKDIDKATSHTFRQYQESL